MLGPLQSNYSPSPIINDPFAKNKIVSNKIAKYSLKL